MRGFRKEKRLILYRHKIHVLSMHHLTTLTNVQSDIAEKRFSSKWIFDISAIRMEETKERNLTQAIPSYMKSLMKCCKNLEIKKVRSLTCFFHGISWYYRYGHGW